MDYQIYDKRPVYFSSKEVGQFLIGDPLYYHQLLMSLKLNDYVTIDHYMQLGQISMSGNFFQVTNIHMRKNHAFYNPLILNEIVL